MNRIVAHVVAFFYVYSVQFMGSPFGLGTRVWLGVIGFLCLAYQVLIHVRRKKIDSHMRSAGLLILMLALLSMVTVVINFTSDLAFITYAPSMFTVACASFAVALIVRRAYVADPGAGAKKIFIAIVVVQLGIALLMFLLPDFGELLNNIQVTSDFEQNILLEVGEFRLSGFGGRFFGAGIVNCYALILIASLVRSVALSRASIFYLSTAFIFITSFGMMMSRTTMIGTALAILFLFLPFPEKKCLNHRFLGQRSFFCLSLVIAPILLIIIAMVLAPNQVAAIEPAIHFGFELFINYFNNEQVESSSTNQLLDMYTQNFNLPLVIGDGYYLNPTNSSEYYKSVDVGYIRLIYYFGLPGLVTYLIFQYQTIRMSAANLGRKEGRKFTAICVMLVLLLNLKGFADIFLYSVYLYACVNGRGAFFRITKSTTVTRSPATHVKSKGHSSITSTGGVTK